jgi:hypothetical protein
MSSKYGFPGPKKDNTEREEAVKHFATLVPKYEAILNDIAEDFAQTYHLHLRYNEEISKLRVRWELRQNSNSAREILVITFVPDIDFAKDFDLNTSGGIMIYYDSIGNLYSAMEQLIEVLKTQTGLPAKKLFIGVPAG